MREGRTIRALPALLALLLLGAVAPSTASAQLPAGFSDRVVHGGLNEPTSIAIGSNGVMFVAERDGIIRRFDGPADSSPSLVADLTTEVMSYSQRGLLSIALDPDYPRRAYLYAGYTHDAPIGGTAPTWGKPGVRSDSCLPGFPDPTDEDGCVVSSRVSRLTLDGSGTMSSEQVLAEDWCQQFSSHSIGALAFDPSGALLAGGGEGAYFSGTDVGERGNPPNGCGDPPGQGGALRAQDAGTAGDPVTLDGSIVRIDPATGAAAPGNGVAGLGAEPRIASYGFRNPFRFTVRPGTEELWVADVGWGGAEEIDRIVIGEPRNFGWPCFEGTSHTLYEETGSDICTALYAAPGSVTPPWYSYSHDGPAVPNDPCDTSASAISGIAFDSSRDFPVPYDGGLFFADYVRNCIWGFQARRDGMPKLTSAKVFESASNFPVELRSGKDGLYYPDLISGTVRRISYDRPTVEVKVRSKPRGPDVAFAGRTPLRGAGVTVDKGARYRLTAPKTLERARKRLTFDHWSDGGRRAHSIKAGRSRSYVAVYKARR